jgi:hypothetical protein
MFNLDRAVEKWREKMFAAGIIKSTSLDELESHLRDHIARLTREGKGVEEAFDAAIQKIGQIDVLKKEFAKAEGFSGWLEHCNLRASQRVLAVLWMAASCWLLLTYALLKFTWWSSATFESVDVLMVLTATYGIIGSVLLSRGSDWGRRIVRTLGFFTAAVCIIEVFFLIPRWLGGSPMAGRTIMVREGLTFFSIITVALLRSTQPFAAPLYASDRKKMALMNVNGDPVYRSTILHGIYHKVFRGAPIGLSATALLVALLGPWFWMRRIATLQESPFAQDSRFVVTKLPVTGVRHYSFPPNPWRNVCSIHGFLEQCTEVSGMRYVIAKDVATGVVNFGGYTNTLTAGEFVQAFAQALQTNQPEFINFRTQKHYRENLVLLTNDPRTVLVLSKAMAQEFERGAIEARH